MKAVQFGLSTDKAVPGDYTGDGKADFALYRPDSSFWYFLTSEDESFFGFPFGLAGDVPIPGDYDGDGKLDVAVFRPADRLWISNNSGGGNTFITFGLPTDRPVPNAYVKP